MRVLILSIKAGMGHHQTGLALKNCFESRGAECEMLDTFKYVNTVLGESVSRGYLISTKLTPSLYGRIYNLADANQTVDSSFLTKIYERALSSKLYKFIVTYNPDVIICTHIFAAQIVNYMKRKGKITCPLIGIITDFTVHPFWHKTDHLDYYVTASSLLNNQLKKKNIDPSKALPIGIPIHPKFAGKMDKEQARAEVGIDNDLKTVLVMMGSMGYGRTFKQIKALDMIDKDFNIIVVCGNNKRLYNMVKKAEWRKNVLCLGYADNVEVLMDASDVIVTKPGGLTSSELLAKGLPAILINPIPGQEDRNVEFLLNNGLALKVSDTFPIDEAMFELLEHEWRFEMLSKASARMGKPNAVNDLVDFVMNMSGE